MGDAWTQEKTVQNFLAVRGGIPFAAEQLQVLLDVVKLAHRPIRRVLDLGCGTGVVGMAVLTAFPGAGGEFVDFSEAMLKQCRHHLQGRDNCHVLRADLEQASLESFLGARRYDAVVSGFAIHHLTEMRKAALYREIFEILEPGGVFVNMEHVQLRSVRGAELWNEKVIDGQFAYQAAQGGGKTRLQVADEYRLRADADENILEPADTQCTTLIEAGFEDVEVYFKYLEMAVFGGFKPGGEGREGW